VLGTTQVRVGDHVIDFKAPYPRVSMIDAHQGTYRYRYQRDGRISAQGGL